MNILEKIGFSGNESTLYFALLNTGPASISDLVRTTGIHRPTVYKILPSLIDKELVSVMPTGKYKKYVAESPEKLEKMFTELEDDFRAEITNLLEMYSNRDKKPTVTYGEVGKALTHVFSDVVHSLKKGDTYFRYSSALALNRKSFVPKDYREVRDKKGLERFIITNESTKPLHKMRLGREVKAVPADFDLFQYNISQIIYGNKVAFVDYNTKTAVTIENPMIAEFQKKIFKLLFKKL